ncbi:hypothetical protein HB364_03420 [Pseudoflavitalea sp. X16]|uniref:hypothetical protein n=1 Tax=Paraflavitalea devenefica TaxID=2716334 RepID=UPI0014246CD1|nr:hypothetical protein [Paraflavitalea devenefica]NII24110.1 hypothetical protein [Paraflavitalea devenefica]
MHHHFIEGINTEKDQCKRIKNAEVEIRESKPIKKKRKDNPANEEGGNNKNKHILPPVEQSPVME